MKQRFLYKILIQAAFFFHFVELTSLLILTYISSNEIFILHMISFVTFLASSTIYMILTIASYYLHINDIPASHYSESRELNSKKYKIKVFIFYLGSFLMSLFFYIRHNQYCEPYIYSFFSLFEYLTVLANILYHSIIFYDLNLFNRQLKISLIEFNKDD